MAKKRRFRASELVFSVKSGIVSEEYIGCVEFHYHINGYCDESFKFVVFSYSFITFENRLIKELVHLN